MPAAPSGPAGTSYRNAEFFPSPFADYASTAVPDSMPDMLRYCEMVFFRQGTYREALRRKLAYFITDLDVTGERIARDEKQRRLDFYENQLDVKADVSTAGMNYSVYGNDFATLFVPFRRYLTCPNCHSAFPIRVVHDRPEFRFRWADYKFHATCPACAVGTGYTGEFDFVDRRGGEESDVRVIHWDPHQIDIVYDIFSHSMRYVWKIPADYKQDVRKGLLETLENVPREVIAAVKEDQAFKFAPDAIYHMKDETLAGVRNRGWGISQVLTNFSQSWYLQVLHRFNEAIALDYVIPFRVITPMPRAGGTDPAASDPVLGQNGGQFVRRAEALIRNRRKNPTAWNVMPFPVQYQALGGEANQLVPTDLINQGTDDLLSAAGIPPSMYKMDLTAANAPPALRLFEVSNSPLVHNLNGYLRWLDRQLTAQFGWEPCTTRWRKVTHADDAQKTMAVLQLMMGRQISQTTGLKALGLDFEDEQKGMLQEEKFVNEETQVMQEEMQDAQAMQPGGAGGGQAGGAPPAGAAPGGQPPAGDPGAGAGAQPGAAPPAGGGGQQATDPQQLLQQATEIAQQLMAMPDSQRSSELINLKKTDETLHAVVTSQMESMKRDAQRTGGEQVLQQQYGKQGSAGRPGMLLRPFPGDGVRNGRAIDLG